MQLHLTHPYVDTYILTTQYNEVATKYPLGQLKRNLLGYLVGIHSTSGVLIMYGAPEAISDNFAFLAQVKLIKSCDAPESNRIIIGYLFRKNVPASPSSPMGISSTVV
jgi:hypothetical protein